MKPYENLTDCDAWLPMSILAPDHPYYTWLSEAGSFMQHLARKGIKEVRIEVLREESLVPENWECRLLALPLTEAVLIREVCIRSPDEVWMLARTVFTPAILKAKASLGNLENRALGTILFQDPNIKRETMEVTYDNVKNLWKDFPRDDTEKYWTRRSLFSLQQQYLLLSEMMMPDLKKYV